MMPSFKDQECDDYVYIITIVGVGGILDVQECPIKDKREVVSGGRQVVQPVLCKVTGGMFLIYFLHLILS